MSMTVTEFEPVTLSEGERARFEHEGFLRVDRPVVGPEELAELRELLQELFARFDQLPRDQAYDLGDVKHHAGPQQIPEINRPSELEPRLATTAAFARCRALASQLLGDRTECMYDHAICKPPHNDAAIDWHQDLAFAPGNEDLDQVHIWLALQDVTEANGCMQFIPNDGSYGLLPHHQRGGSGDSHSLVTEVSDTSAAVPCPLEAGMVTLHRLTTLHSSGPNVTDDPRMGWILQFRDLRPKRLTLRLRGALSRVMAAPR